MSKVVFAFERWPSREVPKTKSTFNITAVYCKKVLNKYLGAW